MLLVSKVKEKLWQNEVKKILKAREMEELGLRDYQISDHTTDKDLEEGLQEAIK